MGNFKAAAIAGLVLLASGCDYSSYKKADGKVLCDPVSGEAYIVNHKAFVNSKVKPMKNGEGFCDAID